LFAAGQLSCFCPGWKLTASKPVQRPHCIRYSPPPPRPHWVTETVSLIVPRKYSTGITILNTCSPCVITKATCVDCLHFKMSFYSSDER
jgi:hypothetical protein